MDINIPWPERGVSEGRANDEQPALTTREGVNVRGIDPTTGRVRGAQRSGMSRFITDKVAGDGFKVQDIVSVTYDNKNTTYSSPGVEGAETTASATLPGKQNCWQVVVDNQANVYALDPKAAVVKYNSELTELWKLNVAMIDEAGELRTIAVDGAYWVYVGVSTGGDISKARIYAYEQKENTFVTGTEATIKAERVWEFNAGGFIERIDIRDGKLYAAVNDTRRGRSWVVVLEQINTAVPIEQKRWDIPYPANDISVSPKDGSVYTAHEPNSERGRDLQNQSSVGAWVDWIPTQLPSWDKRVWGWWDSSDIDGDGTNNSAYEDGDEIQTWYDKSGNGRDWEVNTLTTEKGPLLAKNFVAGRDVLVFDGVDRSMMSGTNPNEANVGTDKASRAAFRGAIPGYSGAEFALFMVVRMSPEDVQRYLLSQDVSSTPVDATRRGVVVNSLPNAVGTDTACLTSVRILEDTTGAVTLAGTANTASGPGTHPLTLCSGPDDFCLISWVFNGGVSSTQSTVRINGRPADQYSSKSTWTCSDSTFLGYSRDDSFPATIQRFRGYVCEMLVLSDWYVAGSSPLDTPTRQTILSVPNNPDGAWAAVSAATTELELVEGYLANKWGGGYKLPSGTAQTLTITALPAAGETVTVGGTVYTFRAALGAAPAAGNVDVFIIVADPLGTFKNLYLAINDSGTNGTNYTKAIGEGANATAFAMGITHSNATATSYSMFIQSRTAADTPTVATTETLAAGGWGGATTAVPISGGGVNVGHYPHKYYYVRLNTSRTRGGPPSSVLDADSVGTTPISEYSNLHLFSGQLCKWNPLSGKLRWVVCSGRNGNPTSVYGGIGYGCTADSAGGIWSIGPHQEAIAVPMTLGSDDENSIFRILDQETTSSLFGFSAQIQLTSVSGSTSEPLNFKHSRIGVDKWNNAYVPIHSTSGQIDFVPSMGMLVVSDDATELARYIEPTSQHLMHAAVPDPKLPLNIEDDLNGALQATQARAEYAYMGGRVENYNKLTFVAQPENTSAVTVQGRLFTFVNSLGAPAGTDTEVLIGGNLAATVTNLQDAINNTNSGGSVYVYGGSGGVHPTVRATRYDTTSVTVRVINPTTTNALLALSFDAAVGPPASNASWIDTVAQMDSRTVFKAKLVNSTPGTGSPRTTKIIAVGNSSLKLIQENNAPQSVSGGGFSTLNSQYIMSTALGQKVYFTNGEQYLVYDPKANTATDYKSTSGGKIPPRCKLIDNWRNRIVLARSADDPQNWHMSAVGEPTNWDQFPPVTLPTQAVSGNNARAGRCPDIINAIIPYSDDLLIFGGETSIWRLTGDPMAGGQMDLLSDVDGIAFGRAWDKDDRGILYFFGARGGLYAMPPGSGPRKISDDSVDARLREINLGSYFVRCVWNDADECIHMFAMPFGSGGTHTKHFVYEVRTKAFWQDEFGSSSLGLSGATAVQPTAAHVIDGDDPDDRVLLIGCEDGYVRKWDETARDDGGSVETSAIDSQVTLGPIFMDSQTESRLTAVNLLLAREQQGCRVQLFVSDTPDSLGVPVWTGDFGPGRNDWRFLRGRGRYLWLRLRNGLHGTRWAFEHLTARVERAGRSRVRHS